MALRVQTDEVDWSTGPIDWTADSPAEDDRLVGRSRVNPFQTPATQLWYRLLVAGAGGSLLLAFISALALSPNFGWDAPLAWFIPFSLAGASTSLFVGAVLLRPATARPEIVSQAEAGWAALHAEISRSRRHERDFTLISIVDERAWASDADDRPRDAFSLVTAEALRDFVRTVDHSWADDGVAYLMLSECGPTQAEAFIERARALVPELFSGGVRAASFPRDAVTAGGLLESLRTNAPIRRLE